MNTRPPYALDTVLSIHWLFEMDCATLLPAFSSSSTTFSTTCSTTASSFTWTTSLSTVTTQNSTSCLLKRYYGASNITDSLLAPTSASGQSRKYPYWATSSARAYWKWIPSKLTAYYHGKTLGRFERSKFSLDLPTSTEGSSRASAISFNHSRISPERKRLGTGTSNVNPPLTN